MDRETKIIAAITALLPITIVIALALWVPDNLPTLIDFAKNHPISAPLLLILWRTLAIIVPPIPGAIVSFALIPVFGWFYSFLYSAIAILAGESVAFLLARKFREPLAKRFVPIQTLHKWEAKLSETTEFLALVGIKLITAYIADFISYAAGLSKLTFRKFFLATLILLPLNAIVFYTGGKLHELNTYIAIVTLAGVVIVIYTLQKSKIFEKIK